MKSREVGANDRYSVRDEGGRCEGSKKRYKRANVKAEAKRRG